jgi:hypothetical protein
MTMVVCPGQLPMDKQGSNLPCDPRFSRILRPKFPAQPSGESNARFISRIPESVSVMSGEVPFAITSKLFDRSSQLFGYGLRETPRYLLQRCGYDPCRRR